MIELPDYAMGDAIPAFIHQTFPKKSGIPYAIQKNIIHLKSQNPAFTHVLYDDDDITSFIKDEYGLDILAAYQRISPLYGAARADLFRYLLLYRLGGVYLDIKSTTTCPLDETIRPEDRYILSHWDNRPGDEYAGWGHDVEYIDQPRGEFQQWHIIAVPGHPFLKAVLRSVLGNIERYSPWRDGVGRLATLTTTGPICYTRAIQPLLSSLPHRIADTSAEIGLKYSCLEDRLAHRKLSPAYYRNNATPLVMPASLTERLANVAYNTASRGRLLQIARKLRVDI